MNKYIALLRGINVGGNNILSMSNLKKILEDLGCNNIQTYIQSGNVVFQHSNQNFRKLANEISKRILHDFGFEPNILILSEPEMLSAIKNNPYNTDNGKILHFFFLESSVIHPDLDKLSKLKSGSEEFVLSEKVFYLYAPDGIGRSKLAANAEKCLGVSVTARNWNTVNKLRSLAEQV